MHGLGTGSDVKSTWLLVLSIGCAAVVIGSVLARVLSGWPENLRIRGAALGVIDVRRLSSPRWPRFVVDSLHRNVSLLAMVFLVLHIITSVLDTFAPIGLVEAFVPFIGSYRPFWLGLGAVSFDLIIAVILTSLLRQRMGYCLLYTSPSPRD